MRMAHQYVYSENIPATRIHGRVEHEACTRKGGESNFEQVDSDAQTHSYTHRMSHEIFFVSTAVFFFRSVRNTLKLSLWIIFFVWIEHFLHFLFVRFWNLFAGQTHKQQKWEMTFHHFVLGLFPYFSLSLSTYQWRSWFGFGCTYLISSRTLGSFTLTLLFWHISKERKTQAKVSAETLNNPKDVRCIFSFIEIWNGYEYIINETAGPVSSDCLGTNARIKLFNSATEMFKHCITGLTTMNSRDPSSFSQSISVPSLIIFIALASNTK